MYTFSPVSRILAVFFSAAVVLSPAAQAQTANAPYVAKTLPNLTVPVGTASSKVKVKKTFGLNGVTQPVVRFSTTLGNIDVELRSDVAPQTVANFVNYSERGAYNGTFFHRSVSGFVIQSGGYTFPGDSVERIAADAPVKNEFNLSNVRGTIAMAKLGGDPDSATSEWFFNEADSNAANLDNQNGGFTVFGDVIGGLNVVDSIGSQTIVNAGSSFNELPVINYTAGGSVGKENLIYVNSITTLPLMPKKEGDAALLKVQVKNSNPDLVTVTVAGDKLLLAYTPDKTGTSTITVKAKNAAKQKAKTTFLVTVQ